MRSLWHGYIQTEKQLPSCRPSICGEKSDRNLSLSFSTPWKVSTSARNRSQLSINPFNSLQRTIHCSVRYVNDPLACLILHFPSYELDSHTTPNSCHNRNKALPLKYQNNCQGQHSPRYLASKRNNILTIFLYQSPASKTIDYKGRPKITVGYKYVAIFIVYNCWQMATLE